MIHAPEMEPPNLRVWRDIEHERQSNLKSASEVGRHRGLGMLVFVPGLLCFEICHRMSGPGLGSYRPRVWRYLNVVAKGTSGRVMAS